MNILAVDIGTTALKMGVFHKNNKKLNLSKEYTENYQINIYNNGLFSDINPDKWKNAFLKGCKQLKDSLANIDVISLSGTTPGLTAMDKEGETIYPAILMLDQRSRKQAQQIINEISLDFLMQHTGNMPVAGGCSLASILWIKENYPQIFDNAYQFGHSNTYIAKWLTDKFAIDPSSASLTALYNTVKNNLTWNTDIAQNFQISVNQLPEVIQAYEAVGLIRENIAKKLGFLKQPYVLIGGNDAVLAAYSAGINEPGDIINVNGTCEITLVCLAECLFTKNYNIRAHVLPNRWLTLYVMNAGGKAFEWFKSVFCKEMSENIFFNEFVSSSLEQWLTKKSNVSYEPYLMGSRYSLEPLKAEFKGLTVQTTREEMLTAVVKGLANYQKLHLDYIGQHIQLKEQIYITGGALNKSIIKAKKKWLRNCPFISIEQSSLKGAAMLGQHYLEN